MDSLAKRFEDAGVRYLLIGGQAVRLHGLPRFSMDWDFFIPPRSTDNFGKIEKALGGELDVDLLPLGDRGENIIQSYPTQFGFIQFHLVVPGLPSFEASDAKAVHLVDENGASFRCVSAEDLLAAKLATNRIQDQQDILFLREKLKLT
jgi:hypothetical protein